MHSYVAISLYCMILCDNVWYYMIAFDIIWHYMILHDSIWHHDIKTWCYMIVYDSIWYHMISYETARAFGCHSSVHSGWETLSFLVQYMISSTWCDAMQIVDWLCGWTMTMTWLYLAREPDITNPQNPLSSIRMCSYNLWFFLSECQVHKCIRPTKGHQPQNPRA